MKSNAIYIYVYMCVCVCVCVCIYTEFPISISIYIYTHTHTYTHTHIYIYKMCIEHLGQTAPMDGQVLILKILVADYQKLGQGRVVYLIVGHLL